MDATIPGYRVEPLPGARRMLSDFLRIARRRNTVHALTEADVTLARRLIREHRARSGETLSFTAFVVGCLARAVADDPRVQTYRRGRRHLVVFQDVDVCVLVEHEADGRRMATPYVIRAANRLDLAAIHREIRGAQSGADGIGRMDAGGRVPGFAMRWFWRMMGGRPRLWKRMAGTVCVTSVGMFGEGAGWGIPITNYTLQLTIGGIATRPGFAGDGSVEPRELLSLTVSVDHDVVDGAPAARFVQGLTALLQEGYGLPQGSGTAAHARFPPGPIHPLSLPRHPGR